MDLFGKIALVTGGARRVGAAISSALAQAGVDLLIHYNQSAQPVQKLADEIRRLGRKVQIFQADLASPEQIESLFDAVGKTVKKLDILVNNAAVYDRTPLDELSAAQWDRQMAVNARAPALCISRALPLISDGGAIINITDTSAEKPRSDYHAYCASKAALLALTRSSAKALAGRGIRVNAVAPGVVLWDDSADPRQNEAILRQVPLARPASPQDVAQAVVFLAGSDYITGQCLRVDGGWCMG